MHLKSIALKGFKSFPDRTRLDFTPGVSVIVGPNGSGKSNVTDAVLWAMGEQSPLAVRGQSMQDVIFGGGRGVQARNSAEVEIVIDNADGGVDLPMGEISILRKLDRNGEGEYRLNGARCRLVDVLEVLSDTGLGKEMHSVVSQGRVEAIVTSKPKDRRLLIEEAAGLGKHRKRRRRAQLKLERTQDNLDRALDIEREARSRLRPLKRQAEAAELHERLERQTTEARWELARDAARAARIELVAAEEAAVAARSGREEVQARLAEVAKRRHEAEEALAQRTEQREKLAQRVYSARSAAERVSLRLERTSETGQMLTERVAARERQLEVLRAQAAEDRPDDAGLQRIESLEAELEQLAAEHAVRLARELEGLGRDLVAAQARAAEAGTLVEARRAALKEADEAAETARRAARAAETSSEAARRESSRVGAELAAANQFLRSHTGTLKGAVTLSDEIVVEPGLERAVAAALQDRLGAALADDFGSATTLLDAAGVDGGRVLVPAADAPGTPAAPPVPSARALAEVVSGPDRAVAAARRALAGVWLVESLADLPKDFAGVAVTKAGRVWLAALGELRQAAEGGEERILAERNRRDALIAESEQTVQAEQSALGAVEAAAKALAAADASRDEADKALRDADRARTAAAEDERRINWTIGERKKAPEQGETAVRRAQVEGELAAERRVAERAAREREERAQRITFLEGKLVADRALVPAAARVAEALGQATVAIAARLEMLEADLEADRAAGEGVAERLRACAAEEAQIQNELRDRGEAVTAAEVRAQQVRDSAAEAEEELNALAEKLGLEATPAEEPLSEDDAQQLRLRIERLARRREQLGPVNPLAKAEYDEAIAHVEELERQRTDLETALRELRTLIRDTDKQIRETFEETFAAAAKNFERISAELFPGGRGRLRLVREDSGPRAVLGGQTPDGDGSAEVAAETAAEEAAEAEAAQAEGGQDGPDDDVGVEIEITPAGKSMKRLTLMSGGEKSMTALAFLFSVFLAKPCPFYILDEVEAALDDLNITRFLTLLQRHADEAQFIVVTHQKRTMEAADTLYGVSMGDDGVSKVVSRKLPREVVSAAESERSVAQSA